MNLESPPELTVQKPIDIQGSTWTERSRSASGRFRHQFKTGARQFAQLDLARERAAFTRWKAIEHLDKYLIEFESNFIRSGGKVIWAQDITDALEAIASILKQSGAKKILKSKTNTATEIGLLSHLESEGLNCQETDAGDFIVQTAGENGSHMVLPAIHHSAEDIAGILHDKLDWPADADAEGIVKLVRERLRKEFREADAGITGCNFLVADPGAVVIMENEGNAQLVSALPRTHIVVAGIDKVLPSLQDLGLFLPLLSTYGTGQTLTSYNSILSGPRQADETDGPEEMYVVLIDNGRSEVLGYEKQRQALACIRCGACQTACPVYRTAGAAEFPSPIQAVTLPLQHADHKELGNQSTLCGACRDVCPVKIDIPALLLENRKLFVDRQENPRGEKWFYYAWKKTMLKRDFMGWARLNARKKVLTSLFKSETGLRDMPIDPRTKSFNDWYREKMNYR